MNFHLNRDGRDVGVFPIEELQRQLAAGELTGSELVRAEGTTNWKPLNSITPPPIPDSRSSSPPQQSSSKFKPVAVTVLIVIGLILFSAFISVVGYRVITRSFLKGLSQSLSGSKASDFVQSSAMDAASKPVVAGTNTLTEADVVKARREFRIRQYIDGYKLRGQRNPECDAWALGMISNWIACNYDGVVDTNLPSLSELGNQLANDPNCTDPLVLTVAANNSVELHEAVRRLERAVKGFQNSKHLGYPKFYATVLLAQKLIYDRSDRLPVLDAQSLQDLQNALADGSVSPEDQWEIADILISGWGEPFFKRNAGPVYAMVQKQGKPFEWLALVLRGQSEINAAWAARGGGYANTVSESGWQGFSKHLANARESLTRAWELKPNWPLAPDRMIYVSLGDAGIGEMRKWFDRTVAAQVDYADAWKEMRWGLRPRWYGDIDSMMEFGITALNTRRFDTDIPRKFFDSLSDVESEMNLSANQHIYGRADVWPHLKSLYEGYISSSPQSDWSRDGWRSTYSIIAYLAGKYDVAGEQLRQLNWRPHSYNLTGWSTDLSIMPLEVAARTGEQAQLVNAAEKDRQAGNIDGALKLYDELAVVTNVNALTLAFVHEREYSLRRQKKLAAGKWIPFLPTDAAFTGWQTNFGNFKLLPDGSLEVSSDENGHMIYCRTPIGTAFEVKGQFEVVSTTTTAFQAGVVMGLPQFETYAWDAFRIKRNTDEGDVASFSEAWIKRQILAPINNLDAKSNSFDLSFQAGRVNAIINGRAVFTDAKPPHNGYLRTNEFLIGLGAFNDSNSSVIRYHDVEIRRLPGK